MRLSILIFLSAVAANPTFARDARSILVRENEAPVIRTTLGYSTILLFDSTPKPAVLGDADAFKVEYVENGVSIKPLLPDAKTNLFVFAGEEKYVFHLTTVRSGADYLIQVKRVPKSLPPGYTPFRMNSAEPIPSEMTSYPVRLKTNAPDMGLEVDSVELPRSGAAIVVHFAVTPRQHSFAKAALSESNFSLFQNKKAVPFHNLFLYRNEIGPGTQPTKGIFVVRRSSLNLAELLRFRFQGLSPSSPIEIPLPVSSYFGGGASVEDKISGR